MIDMKKFNEKEMEELRNRVENMFDKFMDKLCEFKSDENMKCVFIPDLNQGEIKNFIGWAYLQGLEDNQEKKFLEFKTTKSKGWKNGDIKKN